MGWEFGVYGTLIAFAFVVTFRWLRRVQNKVDELTERIAKLEGRVDRD